MMSSPWQRFLTKGQISSDPTRVSGLSRRHFLGTMLAGGAAMVWSRPGRGDEPAYAGGVVFHDRNGSGVRDDGDVGIPGVRVSNGRQVVVTDQQGRWRLPLEGERTVFFVIKPRNWATALTDNNLPRFSYIHDPAGSPRLRYRGLEASGPLPQSIDFPLYPQEEPESFRVLMCGDPQPRNGTEVGYLAQTAVPELAREDAAFGVSLGDIMFDNLNYFEPLNEAFRHVGKPWYNVLGNHDLNFDVPDNNRANDTFLRIFGPTYYAFEYGPVHFLVLNNIEWMGQDSQNPRSTSNYRGFLGERQLAFVREELKHVPKDKLTVILLHIPLASPDGTGRGHQTADRAQLYELLKDRPHTLSLSAHRHWHGHFMHGQAQDWHGEKPHHHVIMATLCGSWFRGLPNERGVPHARMTDGTPRGYGVFHFADKQYRMEGYRVIGSNRDQQMHIDLPNIISREMLGDTTFSVNFYNGCERSMVKYRFDGQGPWQTLERVVAPDPYYVRIFEREQRMQRPDPFLPMSRPGRCYHLWQGKLPANLAAGTHRLEIAAEDMFGNTYHDMQPVRVTA